MSSERKKIGAKGMRNNFINRFLGKFRIEGLNYKCYNLRINDQLLCEWHDLEKHIQVQIFSEPDLSFLHVDMGDACKDSSE